MDWDDVRHFLALARLGSVRAAGASLGVSHSTVARRVETLEAQLSARLFDRTRDGYTLTEAGQQMLPGAERVERELAALERGLIGCDDRLAGPVSLTCCDAFVSDLLIRGLAPFCAEHPRIELCMTTDSRLFDLSRREADVAVRALGVDDQPPGHLIGTKLVPVVVASYVGRDHAGRLDPEREGASPRWLSFDDSKLSRMMIAQSSYPHLPTWGALASLQLMIQAAEHGLGLAMLPTYVGDRQPALQRLSRPDLRHLGDLWLLSHADLRDNARFRAVRRRVAAILREHLPLFSGEGWTVAAPACPEFAPDGSAGSAVP